MIEIMLWKFLWTYQKNHAIENHTMENHVRRGLTVPTVFIKFFWKSSVKSGHWFHLSLQLILLFFRA